MNKLSRAVRLTQQYAAFFHAKLSEDQLHHWLISDKTYSVSAIKRIYHQPAKPDSKHSAPKLVLAFQVAKVLSTIPSIKLIAVTGSLAVNNAKRNDDIDLMIITKQNTLWLTRLLVIPLISLFFKRRLPSNEQYKMSNDKWSDTICLNLWLDESALSVPVKKRNLYTAHEVLQAKPIFDRGNTYVKFILANSWTKKYLANAYKYIYSLQSFPIISNLKSQISNIIHFPFSILNYFAFLLQYLYMKPRITNETVSLHSAYFHPRDFSKKIEQLVGLY